VFGKLGDFSENGAFVGFADVLSNLSVWFITISR
jgi:hypothetical protein